MPINASPEIFDMSGDLEAQLEMSSLRDGEKDRVRLIATTLTNLPHQVQGADLVFLCAHILTRYLEDHEDVCAACNEIHKLAHQMLDKLDDMPMTMN
ncbi:MAG: hypothetical protein PVF49_08265 [Anaerolineales bacterium]|jgi:hypothetical protein